ncbi:MAG TPA: alpha/beta hydrolase-fold protein [Candidatus Saccharimonadaceae bacterium]|nr:alpha/beta hydrolase-fold protein [Candidatus Saccharimonadaceae bacterium]
MMRRGRVVLNWFESVALRGNPAGDPHERRVPVYLPPAYDAQPGRRFPVVFVLAGFTGRGRMLLNDNAWAPALDDRMDLLIARGMGQMILVMPDCLTRFGGSQYLDSTANGDYARHLVGELVPWVDATYRTQADRAHRGIAGKSSGGYGALIHGMRNADVFGAVACHSGDMCFDYCYRPDLAKFCALVDEAGGLEPWWKGFSSRIQKSKDDFLALNILGMAAAYSPNPATRPFGVDLPCDLATGEFREDVWARWLALDPLQLVERHAAALSSLRLLHIDCGTRDEWNLHLGARLLHRKLEALGVAHVHEEFDDGHMNVGYRYDVSLPRLAGALGAEP